MAPHWSDKMKTKAKRLLPRAASGPAQDFVQRPPPASPQPATSPASRPISQPPPSALMVDDGEIPPLLSIQEKLWNRAYDDIKSGEPKLVEAYEKFLSADLDPDGSASAVSGPAQNKTATVQETRSHQMQRLVQAGLDRTQKQASIKEDADGVLKVVQTVRSLADGAIRAVPSAPIAWVGICLVLEILLNPVAETRHNRKGITYVLLRMEWYWNLAPLVLDDPNVGQRALDLKDQLENHIVKLYGKLLSYQMKSISLYHRNWASVIGRDTVKVDDWASQIDEIREAEGAVQRDIEQYSTQENKIQLQQLNDAASKMHMNLDSVSSAIRDQTGKSDKRYNDDKDIECIQVLRETDPRDDKSRIESANGGLLRDSYRWILYNDGFQRWHNDPEHQLLWIKGDPGKGNTMLLCGIIDELEKECDTRIAYFFCQATEERLSDATSVLRGLIYHLVDHHPPLIFYVRERYDGAGRRLFEDGNAWEALSKILQATLNDPSLDGATLVIDALDECKTGRGQLLDFIVKPSRVKWVVSSRNWLEIEQKLDNQRFKIQLELNAHSISQAVDMYIRDKVKKLTTLKNYDTKTRDEVQRYLSDNADGTFLWVALVCQELADERVVRKQHTLSKLKLFPPGLDPLYERMWEQISGSNDVEICKEALAIVSIVHRPIGLKELRTLIQSLEDDADVEALSQIIKSCGSFLILQEGIIYFVHQSAKDFLFGKAANKILPNGAAHQHHIIFLSSLEALSKGLKRDICKLIAPGFSIDEVSSPMLEPLHPIQYSCVYWVDHLYHSAHTKINSSLQDHGDVYRFIEEKFLYWLESLSLLRSMSDGVRAVSKLQTLMKTEETLKITSLLQDARRFILFNKRAIEIAPLQAYVAALIFSPKQSLIRELFEKEEPKWIVPTSKLDLNWNPCLQTLEGHSGQVNTVIISADGKLLASGSDDSTVRIWETISGQCIRILEGHTARVLEVVCSSDGKHLASLSQDTTVKIWDTTIGECTQTLRTNAEYVFLSFPAASLRIVMGRKENDIKTWNMFSGESKLVLEKFHRGFFMTMIMPANGLRLAAAFRDIVKIWDATSGKCLHTFNYHGAKINQIIYSADNRKLASITHDGFIQIWDTTSGECTHIAEYGEGIEAMVFSPNSQRLAVIPSTANKVIQIWDAISGECIQTFQGHGDGVSAVAFSPTDQQLVSCSVDYTIKMWDITYVSHVGHFKNRNVDAQNLIISDDGQRLVSMTTRPVTMELWNIATGSRIQSHETELFDYSQGLFSPNSKKYALPLTKYNIVVQNADSGAYLMALHGHQKTVRVWSFSTDSRLLASASDDTTIRIWDTASGKCLRIFSGTNKDIDAIVFSRDGKRLASSSIDTTTMIWDVTSGTHMQTLEDHHSYMKSLAFSPKDQRIVTCGFFNRKALPEDRRGELKVWDLISGNCTHRLDVDGGAVAKVAFSDDGQRVASSCEDGTIRIWNTTSWKHIQTLSVGYQIRSLRFDERDHCRLHTNVGTFLLGSPLSPCAARPMDDVLSADASRVGVGISSDGAWIMNGAEKILWLPPEYRAFKPELRGSTVAMACEHGRLWIARMLLDTSTNLNTRGLIQDSPSATPPSSTHQHSGETSSDHMSETESSEWRGKWKYRHSYSTAVDVPIRTTEDLLHPRPGTAPRAISHRRHR